MNYYNAQLEILIRFNGDELVILGDEALVSDETLLALHAGESVDGWEAA